VSERVAGFLVTLDCDLRDEDAEAVLTALRMIKRVQSVKPVPASIEIDIAEDRARFALRQKMADVLWPKAGT
jgi:hypothetical protein